MKKNKSLFLGFVFTLLILNVFIRFYGLDDHVLWGDEFGAMNNAKGIHNNLEWSNISFGDIFTIDVLDEASIANVKRVNDYNDNTNALLHSYYLYIWGNVFGTSVYSYQLSSILLGTLLVLVFFMISYKLTDKLIFSFIIAFILTLHPLVLDHARDIRGYALFTLMVVLSSFFLIRIVEHDKPKLTYFLAYSCIVFLMFLSHYFSVIFIGIQAFYLLVSKWRNSKKTLVYFLVTLLPIGIYCLIFREDIVSGFARMSYLDKHKFLPYAQKYKEHRIIYPTTFEFLYKTFLHYLCQVLGNTIVYDNFRVRVIVLLTLGPIAAFGYAFTQFGKIKNSFFKYSLLATVLYSAFLVLTAIKSGHLFTFQTKCLIPIAPFFCFVVLYIVMHVLKNKVLKGLIFINWFGVLGVSYFIFLKHDSYDSGYNNQVPKAAQYLEKNYTPDDTVVFRDTIQYFQFNALLVEHEINYKEMIDTNNSYPVSLHKPSQEVPLVVDEPNSN